jgi:hypothetical protein
MEPNLKRQKNAKEFSCEKCLFVCFKKCEWDRHINTRKHETLKNPNYLGVKHQNNEFQCIKCDKVYKHLSTLSAHKKKCKTVISSETPKIITDQDETKNTIIDDLDMKTLIMELVKSNTELQKQTMEMHQQMQQQMHQQMLEVCKNSNTTINNNHSNNKTFNMQVFLNEKCKDAMNIMDFVNSMTLDFSDLEELGELGYVEGISRQLIRKLSEMDVYKRPIHCSDLKRETMYVRDNDVWEKETEPYTNLRKLIKYITKKNGDLMIPWRNAHPQCMNLQHPLNDTYLAIMNQAMGGKGEFAESENKIIRKISKCVTIDKNDM